MSKSGDKCHYFFEAIKKKAKFEWTEEAEQAFVRLKEHLHTLPRLVSPLPKEVLFMYLSVTTQAVNAVLLAEREKGQIPVYFVSYTSKNAEVRWMLRNLDSLYTWQARSFGPIFVHTPSQSSRINRSNNPSPKWSRRDEC